jgi:hypothetical protein
VLHLKSVSEPLVFQSQVEGRVAEVVGEAEVRRRRDGGEGGRRGTEDNSGFRERFGKGVETV